MTKTSGHKDPSHVIAGFKATISNANTSDEAKENARKQLAKLEKHSEHHTAKKKSAAASDDDDEESLKLKRKIASMKGSLKKATVKEETKERIRGELDEMGVEYED